MSSNEKEMNLVRTRDAVDARDALISALIKEKIQFIIESKKKDEIILQLKSENVSLQVELNDYIEDSKEQEHELLRRRKLIEELRQEIYKLKT